MFDFYYVLVFNRTSYDPTRIFSLNLVLVPRLLGLPKKKSERLKVVYFFNY